MKPPNMKKVTLPKQGSVSVKLMKQKRNRKVLVLPQFSAENLTLNLMLKNRRTKNE